MTYNVITILLQHHYTIYEKIRIFSKVQDRLLDPYIYLSVNLESKDKRLIFNYQSPLGANKSSAKGTIDEMHIFGFNVTQDYLFLTRASGYLGEILTTRIPISGDAEAKKEEVFFDGS